MNEPLKNLLFRIYDVLSYPATVLSAAQMWLLRRYGLCNFPLAHRHLLWRGVFPIRRHYYEPQFHPEDLGIDFAQPRALPGLDLDVKGQLEFLAKLPFAGELGRFADSTRPVLKSGLKFNLDNGNFGAGDIDFYYQMVRFLKPRKLIEIGSGHSTIVALSAIEENKEEDPAYDCELISIEPFPWLKHSELLPITKKVEEVDLSVFEGLGPRDILFIDSSHMVRPDGDVLCEYLAILPRIREGVYIHCHDIFTPYNYPELWAKSWHHFWNEQYLLEAVLSETSSYRIVGALYYLSRNYREQARTAMPLLKERDKHPQSFWMVKQGSQSPAR